jgi:hypothetical protein
LAAWFGRRPSGILVGIPWVDILLNGWKVNRRRVAPAGALSVTVVPVAWCRRFGPMRGIGSGAAPAGAANFTSCRRDYCQKRDRTHFGDGEPHDRASLEGSCEEKTTTASNDNHIR